MGLKEEGFGFCGLKDLLERRRESELGVSFYLVLTNNQVLFQTDYVGVAVSWGQTHLRLVDQTPIPATDARVRMRGEGADGQPSKKQTLGNRN